jgi:hypothetical protein
MDPLGAQGDLVAVALFAAFLGPVGVAHRHADDRDRVVDAGDRVHPGNPPPGADDHAAVDRLPQDPVRAANIVGALGRDGRGLDPVTGRAHRARRRQHHLVAGPAAVLE